MNVGDQKSTISVEGDITDATSALARLKSVLAEVEGQAKDTGAELEGLEGDAQKAAKARTEAARALEFEAAKMKEVGRAQREVAQVSRAALELRIEAAQVAGREGDAVKLTRQLELQGLRQANAERDEAAAKVKSINAQRVAGFRAAEGAAEQLLATQRQIAASSAETAREMSNLAAAQTGFGAVAAKLGAIATGLQSVIAIGQQAVAFADELADQSIAAAQATRTLKIPIAAASEAFRGYVDDVTLAEAANKAVALGVVETGEEFAGLAAGVQAKSEELGVSSQKLLEQAVIGIGRNSRARLDDLGAVLSQKEAEQIYAEQLGVTTDRLTALQKEQAFAKGTLIELTRAGVEATKGIDNMATSYKKARVSLENFKASQLGFDDNVGAVNEALRGLNEEGLQQLRFGAFARDTDTAGKRINKVLEEWDVSLFDVKLAAQELGLSYDELLDKAEADLGKRQAAETKANIEAESRARVKVLIEEAEEMEHIAALTQAEGGKQHVINTLVADGLRLRQEAAEVQAEQTQSLEDEAAVLQATRAVELQQAKAAKGRGGKRRDPSEAIDRERDAALGLLDARKQIIAAGEELLRADLERQLSAAFALDIAREELDVRQRAAERREPRGAEERAELEAELLEIRTDRQLMDLEAQKIAAAEGQRLAEERLVGLDREIERLEALGVATQILQQQRRDAETEFAELFGTRADREELAHIREIERIELAREQEVEAVERQLAAFERDVELATARGEIVRGEAERRLTFEAEIARVEGDADKRRQLLHKRDVARIEDKKKRQQAALSASKSFLSQGQSFAQTIIDTAIKDEKKREQAALRARGVEALARGGLEVVEAAAAFAGFNFVQGALHTAAAAIAFTQGGLMLAGKVPGQGGASAGAGGGGGATPSFAGGAETQQRDLPSTPASAEELTRIRGRGVTQTQDAEAGPRGGVTQIFQNSTMVSTDTGTSLSDLQDRGEPQAWGANA